MMPVGAQSNPRAAVLSHFIPPTLKYTNGNELKLSPQSPKPKVRYIEKIKRLADAVELFSEGVHRFT